MLVPAGTIATAGLALFPFLLPSSQHPDASLTVWDASSSKLTLAVMLGVTALFLPLIIAYTGWVYRVMRGPVRAKDVRKSEVMPIRRQPCGIFPGCWASALPSPWRC